MRPPPRWAAAWAHARRWLPWVLAAAVVYLVATHARELPWSQVGQSLQALPLRVLLISVLLALLAHSGFAAYDLIGRRLTQARIGRLRCWSVAAIAYAFNLNFGALIGGVGMRLRLYTRAGLALGTVAQIVAHSVLANWLGWCWLLGGVLLVSPPALQASWAPDALALRGLGAVLLAVALAYHASCLFSRRRELRWRGRSVPLAGSRLSWLQAAQGATVWLLMSLSLWNLLQGRAPLALVLGSLLLAGVAGAITHVPSGLGVLETVVAAALAGVLPLTEVLAAVLAYRAAHYLLPLVLALPAYAGLELGAAARRKDGAGTALAETEGDMPIVASPTRRSS